MMHLHILNKCPYIHLHIVMPFRDICHVMFCYGQYHYRLIREMSKGGRRNTITTRQQVNVVIHILEYYFLPIYILVDDIDTLVFIAAMPQISLPIARAYITIYILFRTVDMLFLPFFLF